MDELGSPEDNLVWFLRLHGLDVKVVEVMVNLGGHLGVGFRGEQSLFVRYLVGDSSFHSSRGSKLFLGLHRECHDSAFMM